MDKYDVQHNRLRNGFSTISSECVTKLKEAVLSCIPSEDMHKYLSEHLDELWVSSLIEIVVGALKPIDFKHTLISELAKIFPSPLEEPDSFFDFEPYVELYKNASVDMDTDNNVFNVYLLHQHEYAEADDNTLQDSRPFSSFASAIKYIRERSDEWLWGENIDEALIWFTIEKWVGNDQTSLKATYIVSKYGEVWDYKQEQTELPYEFGIRNALGLYLPVPFAAGDVIAIDCRPFVPFKHGVIVSIGDNHDCCCVQCLYAKSDGTLNIGALKHSNVFDDGVTPYISPLYSVQNVQGSLPADDEYFGEIGNAIALWDAELRKQKDFDEYSHALEHKVWTLLEKGNTKDQLLAAIRYELRNQL